VKITVAPWGAVPIHEGWLGQSGIDSSLRRFATPLGSRRHVPVVAETADV
jgi:hypothetical protein